MDVSFTFRWLDVLLVMPAVALFLSSLVPLAIKVLSGNNEPNSFATLCYGMAGVIAAAGWILSGSGMVQQAFDGALIFDGTSTLVGLIIVFVTALGLVFSRENFSTNSQLYSEFVFLMLNAAAGMLLVTWSQDLMFFFVGVELLSLCLYVMIAISAEGRVSKEAAFKYFVLGSFASAILLYGIALIFGTVGSTSFSEIAGQAAQLMSTSRLFLVGLAFVVLGIGFKVSIFPMHAWTPDVYQGAPTPVTAFMATGVKAAVFVILLRLIKTDAFSSDQASRLIDVLQWLAALTMLTGNIAAIMQNNLKRMLAYSSIAHSGYIMVGLIVAAVSGDDLLGSSSVIFYLVGYTVMTLGAFGIISILERDEDSSVSVDDLKGLAKRSPWLAACMSLFLLSMAGIPPLVGFFAKFFIFAAAIKAGFLWLAIWGVVSSVVSVYFYLRPIVQMYMREEEGVSVSAERYLSSGAVSFSAVMVVVFGLAASPLYQAVLSALK